MRERFVRARIDYKPDPAELIDLTHFMHERPEALAECTVCGLVVRDEHERATYETDVYDPVLLRHLFPRYLRAFRLKRRPYEEMLRPGAEVVEIGSHLGAFLVAAEEWGWRATGLDIGAVTSNFARRMGLRVHRTAPSEASIAHQSLDGVFIWNCFEQLENPGLTLRAARTMLKRHGILVLRVPNFRHYLQGATRTLAWNNLLGFPYLIGYTPTSMLRMVTRYGFEPVAGLDATLLTMPFPEMTQDLRREERAANAAFLRAEPKSPEQVRGPWIEMTFRAA